MVTIDFTQLSVGLFRPITWSALVRVGHIVPRPNGVMGLEGNKQYSGINSFWALFQSHDPWPRPSGNKIFYGGRCLGGGCPSWCPLGDNAHLPWYCSDGTLVPPLCYPASSYSLSEMHHCPLAWHAFVILGPILDLWSSHIACILFHIIQWILFLSLGL